MKLITYEVNISEKSANTNIKELDTKEQSRQPIVVKFHEQITKNKLVHIHSDVRINNNDKKK